MSVAEGGLRQAVRIDGRHVSYLEAGVPDGRVLLLLHAFPLSADMYRAQLESVPSGWRLIAPDLPGLGLSEDGDEPPSLDDYAKTVLQLIDRLALSSAAVGGVSLGGYVTMAMARLEPRRIARLVLADTKAPADDEQGRQARDQMISKLDEHGIEAVADAMVPRLLGTTTQAQRPDIVQQVRSLILDNQPEGVERAILRLRDRPDATPGLAAIAVPTLVLVGDEDELTPPAEAQRLAAAITGARLERIPSAGHLASLEQPQAFNRALWTFLDSRA